MCVHPIVSRDSVTNTVKYESNVLDESTIVTMYTN